MTNIEIVPSTMDHAKELAQTLRFADKQEAIAAGLVPDKALFHSFNSALYRKTGLVNGRVAAMWGISGSPLGVVGQPYLITGSYVEDISPIKFAKIYKQEVEEMKKYFSLLENYVDSTYKGAVRMLRIAGFELSEPFKTNTGFSFQKFSMRGSV